MYVIVTTLALVIGAVLFLVILWPYAINLNREVDKVRVALGVELHGKWSLKCVELRAQGKPLAPMFEPPYYGLDPALFKKGT